MATSVATTQIRDTPADRVAAATHLTIAISKVAAMLAAGSGLIHLVVVRHHLDYGVITAGFAVMGGAQLLVAAGLLTKPLPRLRFAGVVLHAGILATWLLSRTVGLLVVRGAEEAASFGLTDTIANMFGVGVITSLVVIELVDRRSARVTLSPPTARVVLALIAVAAIVLTVHALSAPHAHAGHDHRATGDPADQHDKAPTIDGHGDDDHAHE